jgi:RNA polymerase sigma-B factor
MQGLGPWEGIEITDWGTTAGPSDADTRRMLDRWQRQGDRRARDELAERMLPLARSMARRYAGKGEPLEDLVQVACVGLLKAIDRFDLTRDVRFSTYAVPTMAGELKRHFRDKGWMVRVPREVQELAGRLPAARERFTREQGRTATVEELARTLEVSEEALLEAVHAAGAYRAASLDEPLGEGATPLDVVGAPDDGFDRAEDRAVLATGLRTLAEREQEIVRLRFFEGLTQREIAEEVGISQMHVSRLLRRSVDDLRRELLPRAA